MMIEIKKAILDEDTVNQLIELSIIWELEGITFGLRRNTREDITEPCFLALEGPKIVGYTFGHFYEETNLSSAIPNPSKAFHIDEIYVLENYRSLGLGQKLYEAIYKEVSKDADYIVLGTATKDYNKILHFYIDKLGLTFHSALLFCKIEK